jgi:hypothetical protein
MLAVPILIQVYSNAGLTYWVNRRLGVEWCVAGPSAMIGASNFFELAVATAIALFGFQSGAALATVVGVPIEVPVMSSVVKIVKASCGWYERGATAWALSDKEPAVRLRLAVVASDHEQSVPIFQQLAEGHPSGRDDVRKISAVASKRRRSLGRARDRHQPRGRPVLVEPFWPDVRRRDP